MASLRARLVRFLLENRYRLRGRKTPVFDVGSPVDAFRADVERSATRFARPPKDVVVTPYRVPGVTGEIIAPKGRDRGGAILYFHGGGYVSGSVASHRNIVAKLVRAAGVKALSFEYALAPENPFPAALEDALAAYRGLKQTGVPADRIVFAGDSAGAGLVLATLLALKQRGEILPAGAAVLSPWTDLTCSSEAAGKNDPVVPDGSLLCFAHHYCGKNDRTDPLISPLYGDLSGLPPLFIAVGTAEHLRDDGLRFAKKAKAAGVAVELIVGKDMIHCYPILTPAFPEAREAFAAFAGFIRKQAGETGASDESTGAQQALPPL